LKRRFSAADSSLTPWSRVLAVAITLNPGFAQTMFASGSSGTAMALSDRMDTRASCTSGTQRVISSNRSSPPVRIATIVGEGIRFAGLGPSAITRAMFQEYLTCSSVVPAVPWMVSVESPEMAAARCSEIQLLPVPGSPTSSRARSEASVTMARSTRESSPKNLRVMDTETVRPPRFASTVLPPVMYASTARGDSLQADGGLSLSACRNASNCSA
jgi:hypothetical protein